MKGNRRRPGVHRPTSGELRSTGGRRGYDPRVMRSAAASRRSILDEPTAALGVKQAATVLHYISEARARGVGVVFVTHNPQHAYPVGDRFVVLRQGRVVGDHPRDDLREEELGGLMTRSRARRP